MNNISPISKAKRLTEEEVHAAALELKENGMHVSSLEVYKHLGRGSLTTITNFLKTWNQEEQVTTLPALIELPEKLKKAAEQLILKVWTESQAIAEKELAGQREALRQTENLTKEKITEAEAFSDEQAKQIQALLEHIEELKEEKTDEINYLKSLIEELKKGIEIEQDDRMELAKREAQALSKAQEQEKQIKALEERIKELEAVNQENKKHEIKAGQLEAEVHNLKIELNESRKHSNGIAESCEQLKEQKNRLEATISVQTNQINEINRILNKAIEEREAEIKDNKSLREKAAKLEGELMAWKTIKPKPENTRNKVKKTPAETLAANTKA